MNAHTDLSIRRVRVYGKAFDFIFLGRRKIGLE